MLLFRTLNNYDILYDPLANGLVSKEQLEKCAYSYFLSNDSIFISLKESERKKYILDNMESFIKKHRTKIIKNVNKNMKEVSYYTNLCNNYFLNNNLSHREKIIKELEYYKALYYVTYYLSSLNAHLIKKASTITDWISASSQFPKFGKYYRGQREHKIAILDTKSNGVFGEDTIVMNLSSREYINAVYQMVPKKVYAEEYKNFMDKLFPVSNLDNLSLEEINKLYYNDLEIEDIFKESNNKFMGLSYSIADSQFCIYRKYPSYGVVAVLEQLQIDLLLEGLYNLKDFVKLDKNNQKAQLNILKNEFKKAIISKNDYRLLSIFNELYEKNLDVEFIDCDKEIIEFEKKKILGLASKISNFQIK